MDIPNVAVTIGCWSAGCGLLEFPVLDIPLTRKIQLGFSFVKLGTEKQ